VEEEKAETFTEYLSKVFKPNPREIAQQEENRLSDDTISVTQDIPTSHFTINEVKAVINHLNPNKAPGSHKQ